VDIPERVSTGLDAGRYAAFGGHRDDSLFRDFIAERVNSSSVLLGLGAAAGFLSEMNLQGHATRVCEVDPDPRLVDTPYLDEGREGLGESISYESGTFDLVISNNVLEHPENPADVFREARRVLMPGGLFVLRNASVRNTVLSNTTVNGCSYRTSS
jgi:SAM-dependent methyltransferase